VHTFVLQDWVLIKGGTGVSQVNQPEHEWLDLEHYQDVTFWLSVNEVSSNSCSISYQTSPTKDDAVFTNMATAVTLTTTTASTTPIITQVLMLSATVPLARFVRWQINGTAPWEASFRVLVAANAPGL
jgi:hypothetical protein